jgi:hypothetical protein
VSAKPSIGNTWPTPGDEAKRTLMFGLHFRRDGSG